VRQADVRDGRGFWPIACSAGGGPALPGWPGGPEHAGIWLERCYLGERNGDKEKQCRKELYQRAIEALCPGAPAVVAYEDFFKRWQRELHASGRPQRIVTVRARGRVLLHPASNASVTDGSVLLHHTYGVPYLPGSGIKGVARAWLRRTADLDERAERRRQAGEAAWAGMRSDARDPSIVRALCGYIPRGAGDEGDNARSQASVVEFYDALWLPEPPEGDQASTWKGPLALDVVNPHHSEYYTGDADPGDNEEPVPTHRLSVAPGTRFCLVLEGATEDSKPWVDYMADDVLAPALETMGFGAWTSAGYGRFDMWPEAKAIWQGRGGAAASGAAAPLGPVAKVRAEGEWHAVKVRFNPGPHKLSAVLASHGGRTATVEQDSARALLEKLGPKAAEALKKKPMTLRVCVRANGNALEIIDLELPGA
jgi:CRISPR-associated protein Cmr6